MLLNFPAKLTEIPIITFSYCIKSYTKLAYSSSSNIPIIMMGSILSYPPI